MSEDSVVQIQVPEGIIAPLTELLRQRARQLIEQAIGAELHEQLTSTTRHQYKGTSIN